MSISTSALSSSSSSPVVSVPKPGASSWSSLLFGSLSLSSSGLPVVGSMPYASALSSLICAKFLYPLNVKSSIFKVNVNVLLAPGAKLSVKFQLTTPAAELPPSLALTKLIPDGIASLTLYANDSTSPWLVTTISYVTFGFAGVASASLVRIFSIAKS